MPSEPEDTDRGADVALTWTRREATRGSGDDRLERLLGLVAGGSEEVFVELWRTASRFDPARGTARTWIMTCAHRRAIDRVRSAERAARRDDLAGRRDRGRPYDQVAEQVEATLERERHLDACPPCAAEARELRGAEARLGVAVATHRRRPSGSGCGPRSRPPTRRPRRPGGSGGGSSRSCWRPRRCWWWPCG
jgi:hypothetical protein